MPKFACMPKNLFLFAFLLFFTSYFGLAQDTLPTVLQPDVKELLEAKVEVNQEEVISTGSSKETLLREAAGIMSVINAETIRNLAVRDLRELLQTVAGFDFGTEPSEGTISGIMRGNGAASGGILLMIDDIMMNEVAYNTYLFANRISLDHIERIEIIRGAGSVRYGGSAALGVINVITKKYEQGIGTTASVQSGVSEGALSRSNFYFSTAQRYNNKVEISLAASRGYNRQSNSIDKLTIGGIDRTISYRDSAMNTSTNISLGLKYNALKINIMYDEFENKTYYGDGNPYFKGVFATIENTFQLGKKLTFTPSYALRVQEPWNYNNIAIGAYYNIYAVRHTANAIFRYAPHPHFNMIAGLSFFGDDLQGKSSLLVFSNGTGRANLNDIALLSELVYNSKYGNLIVGARLDKYSSATSPVFIPRFAYTKIFGNFHAKALYSFAFRNPSPAEAGYATKALEPQKSQSAEVEVGYKWKDRLTLTANLFNIIISDIIVFTFDNQQSDYKNQGSTGTNGVELELKYQHKKLFFRGNYAYYATNYSQAGLANLFFGVPLAEQTKEIIVPTNDQQFLGFPNHKVTAQIGYRWTNNFSTQGTAIVHGTRTTASQYEFLELPTTTVLNLNLSYRNFFIKGLTVEAGVYNLLDQRSIVAAYSTGDETYYVLDPKREFIMKLRYGL